MLIDRKDEPVKPDTKEIVGCSSDALAQSVNAYHEKYLFRTQDYQERLLLSEGFRGCTALVEWRDMKDILSPEFISEVLVYADWKDNFAYTRLTSA